MSVCRVLSLSDVELDSIYGPTITGRYADIGLVFGCGDLPYYYLEYVVSMLNVPLYFVRGNHSFPVEYTSSGQLTYPLGGTDLHRRVVVHEGLILAGVEGSLRYRNGPYQYSQAEMWWNVFSLIPTMIKSRAVYGRYLDVLITHAPPWGIHDQPDPPHQGIKAFRWLIEVFKPSYHFHGHVHVYRNDIPTQTQFRHTTVINSYGCVVSELTPSKTGIAPLAFLERKHN